MDTTNKEEHKEFVVSSLMYVVVNGGINLFISTRRNKRVYTAVNKEAKQLQSKIKLGQATTEDEDQHCHRLSHVEILDERQKFSEWRCSRLFYAGQVISLNLGEYVTSQGM